MPEFTLGLDLGANSIGWALVVEAEGRVVAAGVRIFPEGVDKFDTKKEKSKTEDRRISRGMRRQITRRARRKRNIRRALVALTLLPQDSEELRRCSESCPYELRRKGLSEKLEPFELGRVFLHLAQRRGFLSNRKADRERKKETEGMLGEINELANAIHSAGHRTLGEHLAVRLANDPFTPVRGIHTRRDMYQEEFDRLWAAQSQFYPKLLTEQLKYGTAGKEDPFRDPLPVREGETLVEQFGIWGLLFFQRSLYWPKSVVGQCELEPKRKRCPRADRAAQRFRLLQEVNNLRYFPSAISGEVPLTAEQRATLLAKLGEKEELDFDKIRKLLKLPDTARFNLEAGKRKKLQGMVTDARIAKALGAAWYQRPEAEKDAIVRALIHGDEGEIRRRGELEWNLSPGELDTLLAVDLPAGYGHLSLVAIDKLLPHLERGLLLMTGDGTLSAMEAAGYLRPDQRTRQVRNELPPPPEVTNPVVRQAMFELRKLVNAIIAHFGKPARIHLELARNAAASSRERQEMSARMREREEEREEAHNQVKEHGVKPTREAIDRYLLWKEQGGECIYSGKAISLAKLFAGEVHVDHILPYSRCLDDSFGNKVVCLLKENRDKQNQTPYEWLAQRDPARFENVCQRAEGLPYSKRRKFTQRELELDGFITRQLNDTRYISRQALEYLRCLVDEPHHVLCPKGSHTETLRWLWGLNSILHEEKANRKNRCDHRHHAIDAVVLALTTHERLQALAGAERIRSGGQSPQHLDEPWHGFRHDVENAVLAINVSHRASRKVAGALHEDTLYGPTATPGEFVVRKALVDLTPNMIEDIRDPVIRHLVLARLKQFKIQPGRKAAAIPKEVWKEPLCMPSGVVIKKVRLLKKDQTIRPLRDGSACVKTGSNHHLCLFEWEENGKRIRDAVFVTKLEANERVKRREPIIQRIHPEKPTARFLMSLSAGEMVLLEDDGRELLCTYETAASTSKQMRFRIHTAGGKSTDNKHERTKYPSTFNGRKVLVTPLGEIRWAND